MPPVIPTYVLDSPVVSRDSVNHTRGGLFFAQVSIQHKGEGRFDLSEFGSTIYGPPRSSELEADIDLKAIKLARSCGPRDLRRLVARIGSLGGTKSCPSSSVTPVLSTAPDICLQMPCSDGIRISGVRRRSISALVPAQAPGYILARVIDVLADVLSCAVDSQLGIAPSTPDLVDIVKHSISRERGSCPISDMSVETFIIPLIEIMKVTAPWSSLSQPEKGTEDVEVIRGFLHQLYDNCRKADIRGEERQLKLRRKERRLRKRSRNTLFVANLPSDVTKDQLFHLFNTGVEGLVNPLFCVKLPTENRSYAFVVCRSQRSFQAVLDKTDWFLGEKKLYVVPRDIKDDSPGTKRNLSVDPDGSPAGKRQRIGSSDTQPPLVPSDLAKVLTRLVSEHPGCNISQIPDLIRKSSPEVVLNPQELGFKNLAHMMQQLKTIRVQSSTAGKSVRPAYHAFPNN